MEHKHENIGVYNLWNVMYVPRSTNEREWRRESEREIWKLMSTVEVISHFFPYGETDDRERDWQRAIQSLE